MITLRDLSIASLAAAAAISTVHLSNATASAEAIQAPELIPPITVERTLLDAEAELLVSHEAPFYYGQDIINVLPGQTVTVVGLAEDDICLDYSDHQATNADRSGVWTVGFYNCD